MDNVMILPGSKQLATALSEKMCFLIPLGRYICWWSSSPWGYHPPSSQCFGTDMVYEIITYWYL